MCETEQQCQADTGDLEDKSPWPRDPSKDSSCQWCLQESKHGQTCNIQGTGVVSPVNGQYDPMVHNVAFAMPTLGQKLPSTSHHTEMQTGRPAVHAKQALCGGCGLNVPGAHCPQLRIAAGKVPRVEHGVH